MMLFLLGEGTRPNTSYLLNWSSSSWMTTIHPSSLTTSSMEDASIRCINPMKADSLLNDDYFHWIFLDFHDIILWMGILVFIMMIRTRSINIILFTRCFLNKVCCTTTFFFTKGIFTRGFWFWVFQYVDIWNFLD